MKLFSAMAATAVIGCTLIDISPATAETELDYKQKAAGFLAGALCSQRLNNHSSAILQKKIEMFVEAYPETPMRLYVQEPKVIRAGSVLLLGLNSSCSAPDMKSTQAKKGMELLQKL